MNEEYCRKDIGNELIDIFEVKNRTEDLVKQLVLIWERSVKETHLFLSYNEIENIKKYVPEAIHGVSHLMIACHKEGYPLAFMGIEKQRLEMLFVDAKLRGQGIGKKFIKFGIDNYHINEVTVNEQNPQARMFYEYMGFKVYKRTDRDEQGNLYPLLYMKLEKA